ncbi:diguanylate cyclase [Candidatus Poribacteria bacterium]|nr:diguanylate cyclase [Candidatus Poribacteria bacterium]
MTITNSHKPLTGKILVIDDEAAIVEVFTAFLEEEGHHVTSALTGTEAMQLIKANSYDVIFVDLVLPDFSDREGGLRLLEFAKQVDPSVEVIIMTGYGTLHAIKTATRLGADFIIKPPIWDEVLQTVANALTKRQLKVERDELVREVERARTEHRELFDLATRDGLTNLYNYRYLQTQLNSLMDSRRPKPPLSLIMIDADNFKTYNDQYGHLKGNEILREIARVLTSHIRGNDLAVRYGGDEFVVLLLETAKDKAIRFAERCVRLIREYSFDKENPNNKITVSAGIATAPEDATSPEELMDKADKALYMAKQAGRNQVHAAGQYGNMQSSK